MDEGWNNHANYSPGQEIDSQIGSTIVFRCYISLWNCVSGNYAMMFHRVIIPCCDMSSDCGLFAPLLFAR